MRGQSDASIASNHDGINSARVAIITVTLPTFHDSIDSAATPLCHSHSRVRSETMAGIGDDEGTDLVCPQCKKALYFSNSVTLRVSVACGHKLCESCVATMFSHAAGVRCPAPGCGAPVSRTDYRKPTFADGSIDRDVYVRSRVLGVYNKRRLHFETLLAYNNYLEEVEDLVFGLTHGSPGDVARIQEELDAYAKKHAREIAKVRMENAAADEAEKRRAAQEKVAAAAAQREKVALLDREAAQRRANADAIHAEEEEVLRAMELEESTHDAARRESMRALEKGPSRGVAIVGNAIALGGKRNGVRPRPVDKAIQERADKMLAAAMAASKARMEGVDANVVMEGGNYVKETYYVLKDGYSQQAKLSGGFTPRLVEVRRKREAYAGLYLNL